MHDCDLAVRQYLVENQNYAAAYDDNQFTMLAIAHTRTYQRKSLV